MADLVLPFCGFLINSSLFFKVDEITSCWAWNCLHELWVEMWMILNDFEAAGELTDFPVL